LKTFFLGLNTIEVCNEFFILIFKVLKFLKNLIGVSLTIVKPLATCSISSQVKVCLLTPEKIE
jgi:hypothetical protein